MSKKPNAPPHDLFISYSSADSAFVEKLVGQLRSKGVALWIDRFEIRPGDYLRERINAAIDQCEYLLAVISPASIGSEWVKHEIDAAMSRELAEKRVRLVPLLVGEVTSASLPPDLRGKNYLDFRDHAKARTELARLLDLIKPEQRARRAFLEDLRAGMPSREDRLLVFRDLACRYRDQTIQKAAIRGLAQIASPAALVIITERLIDVWGMGALDYCISALARLHDRGGLVALACTLFWDSRLLDEKLGVFIEALAGHGDFVEFLKARTTRNGVSEFNIMAAMTDHTPPDISAAVMFSSQYWFRGSDAPMWLPTIAFRGHQESRAMIHKAVPGLAEMIEENFEFRGSTEEDAGFLAPRMTFDLRGFKDVVRRKHTR